jgi:integrase
VGGPDKKRGERLLTAKGVAVAGQGRHADGGGLYLDVDGGRKRWLWRYRLGAKRREMGLGPAGANGVGLAEARAERDRWRAVLRTGADPIEARIRTQSEAAGAAIPTFGEAADAFVDAKAPGWRNEKHIAQWRMTLKEYAKPLRPKRVDQVATADILAVLKPLWQTKPETASRVRGRIEMVLDAERAHGHIEEGRANPARWRGHLDKLLPKRTQLSRGHHAAMAFKDVPAFVARLRSRETVGARAFEFMILTAARTGEAIGATWAEIDLEDRLWAIPPARMKASREHRVPLSDRAIAILEEMKAVRRGDFVFPGARPKRPLSNMVFDQILKRADLDVTAHGFRSSFRDWAGDATSFPSEIAEAALAHVVGDKTERAYRRGDALARRRKLMDAWAKFIESDGGGNVVRLDGLRRQSGAQPS